MKTPKEIADIIDLVLQSEGIQTNGPWYTEEENGVRIESSPNNNICRIYYSKRW